ncbi:hypothetical protein [Amycolatopsis sp. NPDC004378]
MTETTDTATDTGPARPKAPDVSGLGGGRRNARARRLAAAESKQGKPGTVPAALAGPGASANSEKPAADESAEERQVPAQQAARSAAPAIESTPPVTSTPRERQPEQAEVAEPAPVSPIVEPVAAVAPADASAPGEAPEEPAGKTESKPSTATVPQEETPGGSPEQEKQPDSFGAREPAARIAADRAGDTITEPPAGPLPARTSESGAEQTSMPAGDLSGLEDDADQDDDDLDDEHEEFAGGKVTLQTYVPDVLATKFQNMQTTGRTAELIVLTAVRDCAERLPQLIAEARGPVHESGLFAGLEVLEKSKPGRQAKPKPNSSRVQYQVRPDFLPDLKKVAKKHKLKLSVLVRLALGSFFGVPVLLGRAKR